MNYLDKKLKRTNKKRCRLKNQVCGPSEIDANEIKFNQRQLKNTYKFQND